jgi:hydrogenase small subunit
MSEIDKIHVIWLPGQACTGCTVSLLNASHPNLLDLLTGFIPQAAGVTLDYHATVMLPWGDEALAAVDAAEKGELAPFVLVLEGAIPDESKAKETGGYWCVIGEDEEGNPITFNDRLDRLAKKAAAIVCAGTCASYGGIPSAGPTRRAPREPWTTWAKGGRVASVYPSSTSRDARPTASTWRRHWHTRSWR